MNMDPDTRKTRIGACPDCGTSISEGNVLIRYETTHSSTGIWATCPECTEVVDPAHDR